MDDCIWSFMGTKLEFIGYIASMNQVDKDVNLRTAAWP